MRRTVWRPLVEPLAILTVEVPLSDEAQADLIYSVAAVIEAMNANIKILNANIISPNKFEVFLPVTSREPLQTILHYSINTSFTTISYSLTDLQSSGDSCYSC